MITFFLFSNSLIFILLPLEFDNSNSGILEPTNPNLSLMIITLSLLLLKNQKNVEFKYLTFIT